PPLVLHSFPTRRSSDLLVQSPQGRFPNRLAPGTAKRDVSLAPMGKPRVHIAMLPLRGRFRQSHDDIGRLRLSPLHLGQVAWSLRSEEHTSELQSLAYLV